MKKNELNQDSTELRAEYNFRNAVRGRHHKPLHKSYTVEVHQSDGTTVVQNYKLEEGAVMLEPDVRAWFPDSDSVNNALRSLIELMEQMPEKSKMAKPRKKHLTTA